MRGGVPIVASDAVLLLTGTIHRDSVARRYSAVWLLADDRPYAARYDDANRSFVGTIPAADLTPGLHHVFAYALRDGSPGSVRISEAARFRLSSAPSGHRYLPDPPAACRDPYQQLAGA